MRMRRLTLVLALMAAPALRAQDTADNSQRPAVQALQRRVLEVVQRTLGATDDQMRQLADVNRRYQPERRELNQRDRQARQTIRAEVLHDSVADQKLVARELDALVDVQRKRIEIIANEQRDLARFLTPVQRAKYATLQEGLRRKVEQLRQRQQENGLTPLQRRRLRQMRRMGDTTG
jgi:Spy/CpxP family protein refolding chaperone